MANQIKATTLLLGSCYHGEYVWRLAACDRFCRFFNDRFHRIALSSCRFKERVILRFFWSTIFSQLTLEFFRQIFYPLWKRYLILKEIFSFQSYYFLLLVKLSLWNSQLEEWKKPRKINYILLFTILTKIYTFFTCRSWSTRWWKTRRNIWNFGTNSRSV